MAQVSKLRFDRDEIKDELQSNGVVTREITPTPHFMTILESVGYKTKEALSDISDNCVDADATKMITYFGDKNKKPFVVIGDNGTGMEADVLFGALVLGASYEELGDKVKNGGSLGKYGTGLKSSLLSLKGIATIITRVKGGDMIRVEYHKDTIQEYFDKNNAWGISIENASKEDEELFAKYTDNSEHGTVIKVTDINRYRNSESIKQTMIKTYARYFHRFISNGFEIVVNGRIVEPVDLCGFQTPFTLNGETHQSVQIGKDLVFDDLKYTDKNGKVCHDGYLRYRAFLLPQRDAIDEQRWNDEFDWNMTNQGICVYRGNRLIQHKGWFGNPTNPRLNRFRIELDFNGELDQLMNVDFKKTSVDPDMSLVKLLDGKIKSDIKTATDVWNDIAGNKSKVSKTLKDIAKRFSNWARNNANLLPKIPRDTNGGKTKTSTHYGGRTKLVNPVTGKKMRVYGERLRVIYDDSINDGSFYKTQTGPTKNCVDIHWNVNHIMFEDFVQKADTSSLSAIVCMIWAEHYSKETNKPDSSLKRLEEFNQQWESIQMDKGSWLTKMYPTTPKI